MKKARVYFPITLDVDPAAFQGDTLEITAGALAARLMAQLRIAEDELHADGFFGKRNIARVTFDWSGSDRRTFSERQRRAIEKRLHQAVLTAHAGTPQQPKPIPKEGYTVERIEFAAAFFDLMVLAEAVQPGLANEWRVIYRDVWDQKVAAVAWVVTIERAISWTHLYWQIRELSTQTFGEEALFTYLWDASRAKDLRALDKRHLRALPTLRDQEVLAVAPDSATRKDWTVPVGVQIIFVGSKLPEIKVEDYLALGDVVTLKRTFNEIMIELPELLDRIWTLYSLQDAFLEILDLYADQPLRLRVWPFAVTKDISPSGARKHVLDLALADYARAEQLGELALLTPTNESRLPADLLAPARALGGKSAVPDPFYPDRDWAPGVRGVYYYATIRDDQMVKRAAYARRWFSIKADADGVIAILDDYKPFWAWAIAAKRYDAELWDLLLLALDRKGALGRFFDAWLEHNLYPVTFRPLIALSMRSRFAHHPRLRNIIDKLQNWQGGLLLHSYDPDASCFGRIRLFGSDDRSDWIIAAGDSTIDTDGVVAETSSYYSETGKVKRPKKATLERLSEPVRKKVGDLMARLMCEGNETMTEEEIFAQAFKEAAKEADLGKDDFEAANIRSSLRVLKVETRTIGGVGEIYVHWHEVRRFENDVWEKAGEIQIGTAFQFEAALLHYHLQHLMTALTIGVLVVAVVGTGVALVVVGVATIGEVIVAIVLSEAIYLWTNRHEGYTVTGFLLAAWIGELELLGFKGLGKALGLAGRGVRALSSATVGKVLGEAGAKTLTSGVLRSSATRWIAFVLRAGVTGFEFGTLSVLDLLANDLFHMTRCKGLSSSEEYWSRFKVGMVIGAGMELIAIPALAPVARALKDKASTMLEAAKVLRESGKNYGEITKLLLQGGEQIEAALGRTLDKPEVIEPLARGFRAKVREVLRTYGREYETRAYKSLVQLLDQELSAAASRGLTGVLEAGAEKDLDQLLANLARGKVPPSEMLELLAQLDKDAMAALAKSGNLARIGDSPALLGFLRRHPKPGWRLLGEIFENNVDELEGYFARIAKAYPKNAEMLSDNFAAILLRKGNKLPRDVIADLIVAHEGVTKTQLVILDRLQAAEVKIGAFVKGGRDPTLPDFEQRWNQFSPEEQAFAVKDLAGSRPGAVLRKVERQRAIDAAVADAEAKGLPHVQGRVVKPKKATATEYVWDNPDIDNNFVKGTLNSRGVLMITVKSEGPDALRRGGKRLIDDVFKHFGDDKIKSFQGEWRRGSGFEANYNEYVANLKTQSKIDPSRTMTPAEAAWETWTGRYMQGRDFTSVKVIPTTDANVVWPFFEKPP